MFERSLKEVFKALQRLFEDFEALGRPFENITLICGDVNFEVVSRPSEGRLFNNASKTVSRRFKVVKKGVKMLCEGPS